MTTFREHQLKRSFESLHEGRVTGSDSVIEIHLRAFGTFFPSAFEGMGVKLLLQEHSQESSVEGVLSLIQHSENRGTWFCYRFTADSPDAAQRIRFYGTLKWSCVKKFAFRLNDEDHTISNTFSDDQDALMKRFASP